MKKQNNILPLVLFVGMLLTPFCFIVFAHFFNATRQLYEAPDWVNNIARLNLGSNLDYYSFQRPIASNKTEEGKSKNRQIELLIEENGGE